MGVTHEPGENQKRIEQWLAPFELELSLPPHVLAVFLALPDSVRDDLIGDPSVKLCDFEPGPTSVAHIPMSLPGRSVVLKRNLRRRSIGFVRYVIAHELAHSHLRNRGRVPRTRDRREYLPDDRRQGGDLAGGLAADGAIETPGDDEGAIGAATLETR